MLGLWRKWISYPIWWAIIVGGFALLLFFGAGRGQTYPDMESFHGDYVASRTDGGQAELRVTETVVVFLRNERGILRDLITTYGDHALTYEDFTVVDETGEPVDFTRTRQGNGDIQLRIGSGARITGKETYVISYRMSPAMVGNANYQELYFNVNGTEWPNGFKKVSATLRVDSSLADGLTGAQACYVGKAGSTDVCDLGRNGQTWRADVGRLGPWENLTIAVGFEPGTVTNPIPPFRAASLGWLGIGITLGIGGVALLLALGVRALVGNLRVGETGVVTQFDPPQDMPPVVASDFLGRPERGAAAHLAWLVTSGHGRLTGSENLATAPGPDRDDLPRGVRRHLRDDIELEWEHQGMRSEMRRVTELLFGQTGTPIAIGRYRRYSALLAAQEYRDQILENRGLRHRLGLGPVMLWLGFLGLTGFGIYQVYLGLAGLGWWFLLATLVSFLLLVWGVYLMPVHGGLTRRGKEVRRHLMGLERFLTMSEANRISWLQNAQDAPREDGEVKLYEKLLPWAIVFGVEQSWAQLLGNMYDRFPEVSAPELGALAAVSAGQSSTFDADRTYYDERRRIRHSFLDTRADIGSGSASQAWSGFWEAVSELSSGRGDDDSSTRGSGRGWGGGSSSGFSGGSGGGGFSGGGTGGGGGGRW